MGGEREGSGGGGGGGDGGLDHGGLDGDEEGSGEGNGGKRKGVKESRGTYFFCKYSSFFCKYPLFTHIQTYCDVNHVFYCWWVIMYTVPKVTNTHSIINILMIRNVLRMAW